MPRKTQRRVVVRPSKKEQLAQLYRTAHKDRETADIVLRRSQILATVRFMDERLEQLNQQVRTLRAEKVNYEAEIDGLCRTLECR